MKLKDKCLEEVEELLLIKAKLSDYKPELLLKDNKFRFFGFKSKALACLNMMWELLLEDGENEIRKMAKKEPEE